MIYKVGSFIQFNLILDCMYWFCSLPVSFHNVNSNLLAQRYFLRLFYSLGLSFLGKICQEEFKCADSTVLGAA